MGLFDGLDKKSVKILKMILRKPYRGRMARELKPLTQEERYGGGDTDGSTFYEYGFLPQNTSAWSDDEIREYIDEHIGIPSICSPYDCTGRRITLSIHWHRNPCGLISYVHWIGIDL